MKLNKKEFVGKIVKKSGIKSSDVLLVLSTFQNVLLDVLMSEKETQLLDLGKLKVAHRKSRQGINPKTKQPITLAAKDVVKIAPSKKLKSFVAKVDSVKIEDFTY